MKRVLLLFAFVLLVTVLVRYSHYASSAQPPIPVSTPQPATPAQIEIIEKGAAVIRRGKTATVVYQEAALLKDIQKQVESQHAIYNPFFSVALYTIHEAATFKAQGLETHNAKLIREADSSIQFALEVIHSKVSPVRRTSGPSSPWARVALP